MHRLILMVCLLVAPVFGSAEVSTKQDPAQLLQQAIASYAKGNYQESLRLSQLALDAYRLEANRQGIADASYQVGRGDRKLGKFDEALRSLKDAQDFHKELQNKRGVAADVTEIAVVEERRGNYDEALTLTQKALTLNQEIGNKEGIARSLENFAVTYFRRSDYQKSLEYFDQALSVATETGNKETLSNLWTNKGQVYYLQGDYRSALECYDRAQKLAEQTENTSLLGPIIGNRALVYWDQGNLKQALEDSQRVLELFEQAGNKQHAAEGFENIGGLHKELGNYEEAQEASTTALKMAVELKDKGLEAVALNALSSLYYELRDYDLASDYLQRSLKISDQTGEKRESAQSLVYLGNIQDKENHPSAAIKLYQEAVERFEQIGDKVRMADTLEYSGLAYAKLGEYDRDLEKQRQALAIYESIGNPGGIGTSNLLIGSAYYRKGMIREADTALKQSVEVLRHVGWKNYLWQSLYQEALVARHFGRRSDSVTEMKEAIEIIEQIREKVGLEEQKLVFLENKFQVYDDLVDLLVKENDIAAALEYAERSKARAFLDLLSENRIDPQSNLSSEQYERKRELIYQSTNLNQQIREEYDKEKPDTAAIAQMKQKQEKLDEDYMNLMIEIRKQNPRYAQLQYPEPLTGAQAQKLVDSNSALLEYFVGKHSKLFVVTSKQIADFSFPEEGKINQEVKDLRDAIQRPEPVWEASEKAYTRYRKAAASLYTQLLRPAQSLLTGKKRLIVSPDGSLNYLPFECLLSKNELKPTDFSKLPYVGLKYDIQYIPSASALTALQQNRQEYSTDSRKALIAFADPVVQGGVSSGVTSITVNQAVLRNWSASAAPLPYARAEVDRISKLYPSQDIRLLLGKEASEKNVKSSPLNEYRVLHFAGHGLVDEDNPQFSALLLTPGDPKEDGFLTMREIFDLRLNADLVVLSACKTGLGREIRSEGLAALSRAFFAAGSSSVVASLWNVADESTAEFMWTFYKNLKENGMSKTAALKAARAKMIASGKFSHPYYWAPFILLGMN